MSEKCERCDGCGQIANSDDGEPWTVWLNLPAQSAAAVVAGIVRPIPCPDCLGTKDKRAGEAIRYLVGAGFTSMMFSEVLHRLLDTVAARKP